MSSQMYTGLHVEYPLVLSDFNQTRISPTDFRKVFKYRISWKSAQWEPSCSMRTDRQTEGQRDMTRTIVAFRNFANAPKKSTFCSKSAFMRFVWISEETKIISLHRINWFIFITEKESVYCGVRRGEFRPRQTRQLPRAVDLKGRLQNCQSY